MTHFEMVKEAEAIAQNPSESWKYILEALKHSENSKLNHTKVFKDTTNKCWYINETDSSNVSPFGFLAVDYLNQLISLKSLDSFVAYEKRTRSGAADEHKVTPTFDKGFRFYLWAMNEENTVNGSDELSDTQLEELYNSCAWLWQYIGTEIEELEMYLKKFVKLPESEKLKLAVDTYNHFRYLILKIWQLQISASVYSESDEIKDIQEITDTAASIDFNEKVTSNNMRFLGYSTFEVNNTISICEKYDIPNLLLLIPEDFMLLLLNQVGYTFKFCDNCGCLYVATNGNKKYCSACSDDNKKLYNTKRKENTSRYLHKKINDYINQHFEDELLKESFLNESNYYYSVVKGKTKTSLKKSNYSTKIKTETDYLKWLEKEFNRIKKLNK